MSNVNATSLYKLFAARGLSPKQIGVAIDQLTRNPSTSPYRKSPTPRVCGCGCGDMTKGGKFRPGHDAKLLSAVLAETRAALAELPPAPIEEPVAVAVEPVEVKSEYVNLD